MGPPKLGAVLLNSWKAGEKASPSLQTYEFASDQLAGGGEQNMQSYPISPI